MGVHSPHEAPRHCSNSSRMTCSSKTCTALTAKWRKCCRNSSCWAMRGDDDCEVEPFGDDVIGLCLGTGIVFSFRENMGTIYACSILSAPPLRKASALHNTWHGVRN